MQNKEIEKLLSCDNCPFSACEGCEITWTDRKKIREYIEQLEKQSKKIKCKLKKDMKKNNEFEFMPLQIEKAYNNYYKLGKIDEAQEILELLGEK